MEQLRERHAKAGLRELSRHERVAFGDEGEAQPRIDLPDPVRAGVSHVPEPRFAGLDSAGRLTGVAQNRIGEGGDHDDRDRKRWRDRPQKLAPWLMRLPHQPREQTAVRREERQGGSQFRGAV